MLSEAAQIRDEREHSALLRAERDRYRLALEEIMERNRLDTSNPLGGSARAFHIARRALLPTTNQEEADRA